MLIYLKNLVKKSLFRELSWYTFAQIVVQVVAFISVIIVSRYLGPINLGLYSFVQNYVGAFLTVVGGMDFYFMWKIAKSETPYIDLKEYVEHKFNIYIILSVLGIVTAFIVLPKDMATFATIMFVPVFLQSFNALSFYVMANNRAKLMSLVQITAAVILLILKLFLVFISAPLVAFIFVAAIDLVITSLILFFYFLRNKEWRRVLISLSLPSLLKSIKFLQSIYLSVIAIIFWQLLLRIDQLVLATVSNAYTLGIYSAAVKIAEVPNFLAGVLSAALISRIAHISKHENEESEKKLKHLMIYYLVVGCLIALFIVLFSPILVHILYGSKFDGSISILKFYALSIPVMFINYFFLGMYGAKDRQHHQVLIFGLSLIVNVVLIYVFVPILGASGAALSTVIAYTLAAVMFYINLKKKK